MVTVNPSATESEFSVLAQANLSITAERLMLFYLALSLCSLLIAIGLSLIGYWPVLIFAIGHQLLVGVLLWHSWRKQWVKEWIVLNPDVVQVVHIDHYGRRMWQVESQWVRLEWRTTTPAPASSQRLFLRNQANQTEIGSFLSDAERKELAKLLQPALDRINMF